MYFRDFANESSELLMDIADSTNFLNGVSNDKKELGIIDVSSAVGLHA